MKIAMLCASPPRGDENGWLGDPAVVPLSRALDRAGHQVHLFSPAAQTQSSYHHIDGLHFHRVAMPESDSAVNGIADAMLYCVSTTQDVAGRFDAVHGHDPLLLATLCQIHSRLGTNTVLTLWRDDHIQRCHEQARDLKWRLGEIVGFVTCPSLALRDSASSVLDFPGDRVVASYPGLDAPRYGRWIDQGHLKRQLGFGPFDPVILCLGDFHSEGDAWILLESAFALRQRHPAVKLVFVGDGPFFPYLRERSGVLGLDGVARFLRFIPESQLIDLYNGCDIVHVATPRGVANAAVLESWAAGKLTIMRDSALPEFYEVGITGLCAPQEPGALAEMLGQALEDREKSTAIGRAAWRKATSEFSWDAIATDMTKLYEAATPGVGRGSPRTAVGAG